MQYAHAGVAAHGDLHPRLEASLPVRAGDPRRSARVCRTSRAGRRTRRPRSSRRGAGSSPARTRRRRTGSARRSARAAPRRSSRRRRPRGPAARACSAAALPRYAARRVSGFSRIVHVLKTRTSASSCGWRLAEPERLEHALDPLGVVGVHLAPERRDVVAPHRRRSVAPSCPEPSVTRRSPRHRAATPRRPAARRRDPSASNRSNETPAMVSTSPDRVLITPHQSTAARSPSTSGSPNRHSADA